MGGNYDVSNHSLSRMPTREAETQNPLLESSRDFKGGPWQILIFKARKVSPWSAPPKGSTS